MNYKGGEIKAADFCNSKGRHAHSMGVLHTHLRTLIHTYMYVKVRRRKVIYSFFFVVAAFIILSVQFGNFNLMSKA